MTAYIIPETLAQALETGSALIVARAESVLIKGRQEQPITFAGLTSHDIVDFTKRILGGLMTELFPDMTSLVDASLAGQILRDLPSWPASEASAVAAWEILLTTMLTYRTAGRLEA